MSFRSISVFSYGVDDYLREVAKKNSETDITLYSRKNGDVVTTYLEPKRFPEKISSLTDSIFPADVALVGVSEINRNLGEVLMALSLVHHGHVIFMVQGAVDRDLLNRIIDQAGITSHSFFEGAYLDLSEKIEGMKAESRGSGTCVVIDQYFKVKGVGTVVLGFVLSGTVEKHQHLQVSYADKEVEIRSIQMQDIDVDSAGTGSRVGLALKGIDVDEIERGMMLSASPFQYFKSGEGSMQYHSSLRKEMPESYEVFVSDFMRYQRGILSRKTLELDRKIVRFRDELTVVNPNASPRVLGLFKLPHTS